CQLLLASYERCQIIDERVVIYDRGYFRAKLKLTNDDFVEIAEYFTVRNKNSITKKYRYQWMDKEHRKLIKRWDNSHHFPNLPGFPHHVHIGKEDNVETSESIGIIELIDIIAKEIKLV
ncbi:MAG: hypothetical protein KAI29_13750, partial [Cyclobacteriaceae bacterium]|nr:hypothetical protein [Cyclobacteriaceae bacterium]